MSSSGAHVCEVKLHLKLQGPKAENDCFTKSIIKAVGLKKSALVQVSHVLQ